MPTTVNAFAAKKPASPLEPFSTKSSEPGDFECEIEITHCGVCRSDVHLIDNDWGISRYPLVPGHEIIGTVVFVGKSAENIRIGDRVGVGWQCGACFACEFCRAGHEHFCSNYKATCVGRPGGFADRIVVDARFAFPIPKDLASEVAAPLMCGGLTVFSPLDHFKIGPQTKLGVIGLGGLGHMAVQFGSRMGANVAVLSFSSAKKNDAEKFGAQRFIRLDDAAEMSRAEETMDFILSTVPADLDWMKIVSLLRPDGTLCLVGVSQKPISIPGFALIDSRKRICGSPIGSRWDMIRMLNFTVEKGVTPRVEVFRMKDVNSAVDRLRQRRVSYRAVLKRD